MQKKSLLIMFIIIISSHNVKGIQYSIHRIAGIWEIFSTVFYFFLSLEVHYCTKTFINSSIYETVTKYVKIK